MDEFKSGVKIPTTSGTPVVIEKHLAEGGQGHVYLVTFNGEKKALKWYKPSAIKEPAKFRENLQGNVDRGAPDAAFLWPQAVTMPYEGSFGYVMDLRKDDYHEFEDYMLGKVKFGSFKAATEACIRIVSAFRLLHNRGYCYQDLNAGNFFIHPSTGDVLICDNDNVAPNSMDTFILGTPQYMAPEVVAGRSRPNTQTDRFSLAVVLFTILCMNHPLEGKRWTDTPCLTPQYEKKLYGDGAVFLYDPTDSSNRPVKGVHNNVMKRWGYMPAYIKDTFIQAFSKDAIANPGHRLRELDWLKVLIRFQGDIVRCPHCRNEVFIQNASDTKCDGCGRVMPIAHTLKFSDYTLTAAKGTRVYRCQLSACNADNALDRIGVVVENPQKPGVLGFRNMSQDTFEGRTPSGSVRLVKPKEVVPLKAGITLKTPAGTIEIC